MTPAVLLLQKQKISHNIHEYSHDAHHSSYGLEAAEKLAVSPQYVFKTLVVKVDGQELVVAVVPVTDMLSLKQLAKSVKAKKAVMANKLEVERTTGYVLGGVSPLGQKKRLKTIIDSSAAQLPTVYVSGGKRGLEIELAPKDLAKALNARFADLTQPS